MERQYWPLFLLLENLQSSKKHLMIWCVPDFACMETIVLPCRLSWRITLAAGRRCTTIWALHDHLGAADTLGAAQHYGRWTILWVLHVFSGYVGVLPLACTFFQVMWGFCLQHARFFNLRGIFTKNMPLNLIFCADWMPGLILMPLNLIFCADWTPDWILMPRKLIFCAA